MFQHRFFISTFLFAAYCSPSCFAQIFQNMAPAWGIVQQNWNGHYGAAISTADWYDDGGPTLPSAIPQAHSGHS